VTHDDYHGVFVAHHARVVRLAYLLTGDRHQAEDAAAAAFVAVYPKWRDGSVLDAGAYLRKAVANQVRQAARHDGVRERHDPLLAGIDVSPAGDAATVEHTDVMTALRALPDDMRATIVLRFYGDFTEAETAEILGIAPGTVKSRTARAIERLRPLLKESSDD
jgi:RNA polymerase sigma-70 factor (sigma-E family)